MFLKKLADRTLKLSKGLVVRFHMPPDVGYGDLNIIQMAYDTVVVTTITAFLSIPSGHGRMCAMIFIPLLALFLISCSMFGLQMSLLAFGALLLITFI